MPLTTAEANALLNASTLNADYPHTTGPTKLALLTANSTETAPGTEVTGGSGPYSRQDATFAAAASGGAISNSAAITFAGMPTCSVTGVDVYDSAATPNRKWFGPLTPARDLQAGDSLTFAIGALVLQLS